MPESLPGQRPEDYGRHRRIVKTDEFSSVFRLRPAFRTEHFALYQRPNSLDHPRLGIVVAKRLAQRAVTRNMIKRVAREAFRRALLPNVDCIIRLTTQIVARGQTASSSAGKRVLASELQLLLDKVRQSDLTTSR
ncbi:MAG: ribonuclease protein component [Pseudomonadota bacterium]|nr:ribonuclease P protein component [Oxalobacteraceae bacterium]